MGDLWRIKYGQVGKDIVYDGAATNLTNVATDEIALWVGTGITNNDLQRTDMANHLRNRLEEDGWKQPAGTTGAELRAATLVDGGCYGQVAVADIAQAGGTETIMAIAYGATYPRTGGQYAGLLFDEMLHQLADRYGETKA